MEFGVGGKRNAGGDSYRVVEEPGLKIVFGSVPLSEFAQLLSGAPDTWRVDAELSQLIGANLVAGTPEALSAYRRRAAPGPRRCVEVTEALAAGLSTGAVAWVLSGERGESADALFQACVSAPVLQGAARSTPKDGADFNRCALLQRAVFECADVRAAAAISPQWAKVVAAWDELLAARASDLADGRAWQRTTAALRALGA